MAKRYFISIIGPGCHQGVQHFISCVGPVENPANLRASCSICGQPGTITVLDERKLDTIRSYYQVDVDKEMKMTPKFGKNPRTE